MKSIKTGTTINVATLVFVTIKDKETTHHGRLFSLLKKAFKPLSLFFYKFSN
ncbi:hypothetical protein [Algibacter sp. L1A34]|uniref:hypothetical protein n=1 Tax=Algibacter sp. L1A34 TaxID=2686365 RepID=UPI00131D06AC|nr:hypothetical protein [Algibacter sp. L1A34]